MDVLSRALESIRVRETNYFRSELAAPWGIESRGSNYAQFHLVVGGGCWLGQPRVSEPIRLERGDLVLLPFGDAHWLGDSPNSPRVLDNEVTQAIKTGVCLFGGTGPRTTLVCGYFRFDRESLDPLLRRLPSCIHLNETERRRQSWLDATTNILASEVDSAEPGAAIFADRIAEGIFIHVLRAFLLEERRTGGQLEALANPQISMTLELLHGSLETTWTLHRLARRVGMSRSVLSKRFRESVGKSPMQYLGQVRMARARELILTTGRSLTEIAGSVGFGSSAAFTRAFKRTFDVAPAQLRRAASEPNSRPVVRRPQSTSPTPIPTLTPTQVVA